MIAIAFCVVTPAAAGQGLDLLVIVDRSASMPDRRAALLLLRVVFDIVARNGEAMRLQHRVGVIGFGSTVSVDMPLASVGRGELPRLNNRIDRLPTDVLGDTDVGAAFAEAVAIFRALPPDPQRRRAILLLTDGIPYVRGVDMHAYRAKLQRFAAEQLRGAATVDILLLDSAAGRRYAALWRALSFDRVHSVAADRAALLAETHRVATRLVGTSSAESMPSKNDGRVDVLVIPPYLDLIVLDVFRSLPSARVEIFPPGASQPLRGGADGAESVELGNVVSTLIVHRPAPGTWAVRKSSADARVRVLSQQFFPRGMLVQPAATDALRQYDRVRVLYKVVDAEGNPLDELPSYKLGLELALARPDGDVEPVVMERRPELGGIVFAAARENECTLAGRYWTAAGVTSVDAEGMRVDVFRDRWSGFSVAPATRIDCRVAAIEQHWLDGVEARVQCVDEDQHPVEMSAFAIGSANGLFRPLLQRDGEQADAALDLEYLGDGAFRGRLSGAERAGAYRLQLDVDRARLRPAYNVRFVSGASSFVRSSILGRIWPALLVAAAAAAVLIQQSRRRRVVSR